MMTRIILLLKENSLSIILILLRMSPCLRIIYMYMFVFLLFLLYVYFFRSFIFFHLTTIHSFLFSQGQKNSDIDLHVFCSYSVVIYPLRFRKRSKKYCRSHTKKMKVTKYAKLKKMSMT